jgi:hypothetical protein
MGCSIHMVLLTYLLLVGDPDDHKSTTSYKVFLCPSLVLWCAKKQSIVSRSSTEAEYRAIAMTTTEVY